MRALPAHLASAFRRKRPRPIQRILFVELSEMGSTTLAELARQQSPQKRLQRQCLHARDQRGTGFQGGASRLDLHTHKNGESTRLKR